MDTSAFRKVYAMDNTTKTNDELDKYLAILKNVKPYKDGYLATCPNPDAHEFPKGETTNFQIGIEETNEANKEKFGDYMVVYYCHAHGEKGYGPCSNKVLAKIFKDKYGLGKGPKGISNMQPCLFPRGDDSYLNVNGIGERNSGLHFYTDLAKNKYFLVWRLEDKKTGKGKYFPLSYSKFAKEHPDLEGNGGWVEKNLWDLYPIFQLHLSYQTKKTKAMMVEGESTCLKAQEYFPDYFVTTCAGGANGWRKTKLETLMKFEELICFPDNDNKGKREFKELALYCNNRGLKTKLVDLPRDLPSHWDLKDIIPDNLDIHALVESAVIPSARDKNDYSDIDEDILRERWSHIEDSRKYHYDHHKNKMTHNDNINLWYARDITTRMNNPLTNRMLTPVRYLHQEGCDRAQGLAFVPSDEKVIWDNKKKYINSYVPFKHKELTQEEIDKIDISDFFLQLEIICNEDKKISDYFLDVIAFTIQQPAENLKFATLVVSPEEGTGKTNIWKCIERIHGGTDYCMWVGPQQLTSKLGKSWLKECINIFCNEVRIVGTRAQKEAQIDILKDLIDGDTHTIEPKGVDPYQIKNNFNCFFSSNDDVQELISSKTTRRYFVVNCNYTRGEINEKYPTLFENMNKFINDKDKIARLYYYFAKEHKIAINFKAHEPMITQAKLTMARAIRPQIFKDLDEMRINKQGPFLRDLVNTRAIQNFCKNLDKNNKTKDWIELDENKLNTYLLSVGKRLKNGEPINLDGTRKRGWFAIRKVDYWVSLSSLTNHRLHLAGKFDVPDFKNKQEELETQAPQGALKTTNNNGEANVEVGR